MRYCENPFRADMDTALPRAGQFTFESRKQRRPDRPLAERRRAFQGWYRLSFCVVWCLVIGACAGEPITKQYRKIGTEYHENWFKALPETPSLHTVIEIRGLTIHMVSDRKDFDWEKARDKTHGIAAYANTGNKISILGKRIGGKIVVNQLILGHEFNHILNFANPDIVDPHDKATLESCIGKKLESLCK
jgi:hypothetical protein